MLASLHLDNDPSLIEIVETAFSEAVAMYPDETQNRICVHLVATRREYEKVAANHAKQAVSVETFFSSGLWKEPDHWSKVLKPSTTVPKDARR